MEHMEQHTETTTQVLQRIEKRLEANTCVADAETYQKHCMVLQSLQESIPRFEHTLDKIDARLDATEKDITIMKTEKKTVIAIAGIIGALAGWLVSVFKHP